MGYAGLSYLFCRGLLRFINPQDYPRSSVTTRPRESNAPIDSIAYLPLEGPGDRR
jgi:hypothetical protein